MKYELCTVVYLSQGCHVSRSEEECMWGGGMLNLRGRELVNRYIGARNESGLVLFTILPETVRLFTILPETVRL